MPDDPNLLPIAIQIAPSPGDWKRLDAGGSWIRADLPLNIVPPNANGPGGVVCWIEVGPARDLQVELHELGREEVRSAYQAGTKSRQNPAYEVAQLRVRQAEREQKEGGLDIITVGDPMLDLVGLMVEGVVGAFGSRSRGKDLEEAIADLAATQRSLEQPVWRHYHFERTLFRGRKSALIPVKLVGQGGDDRHTLIRQREQRGLEILEGLDPRDRDYEAHDAASVSELELQRWMGSPPEITTSALVKALIDPSARTPEEAELPAFEIQPQLEPGAASPPATVVAARDPDVATEVDPRPRRRWTRIRNPTSFSTTSEPAERPSSSLEPVSLDDLKGRPPARVVPIAVPKPAVDPADLQAAPEGPKEQLEIVVLRRGGAGRGIGTHLSPHTVITTASVVGDANVLEVEVGGRALPAMVAIRDPARDLALVKVSRAGVSVPLDGDQAPRGPLSLLSPGLPASDATIRLAEEGRDSRSLKLELDSSTGLMPGTPILHQGRLLGVLTTIEGQSARATSGRSIAELLDQVPNADLLLD